MGTAFLMLIVYNEKNFFMLNHHNSEYVTWKHEELLFAILGGIRIEGLHSMRITLKVEFKTYPAIRHTVDLYCRLPQTSAS